ncbi:SIL1 factor, partial [Amia calva]|nr:SIL1 factor [Amia calva]
PQTHSALSVVETTEPSDRDGEAQVDEEINPEDLEVFQPTDVWQSLRPGQAVPVGSHVRLNLQTGEREVKLGEEARLRYWHSGQRKGMLNTEAPQFSAQELKEALKKFKEEEPTHKTREKEEAAVRARYRPLEELKRDMEELNMMVETDFQVMSRLVKQFNRSEATLDERVAALLDLEYLVHQVDNAQDLVAMGGLRLVIDSLNSSEPLLQENSAFVLGSALSSNPRVQVEAVEGGALQKLLLLLATDRPLPLKKKALFAVACLLRHFPFAQRHFLQLGGLQVLGELFRTPGGGAMRVRVVTLLYDMIVEKELISQAGLDVVPDASHQERLRQYSQVSLLPLLEEQGWCGLVPELLASPEHDWREKALRTLLAMMPHCQDLYRQDRSLARSLSALQEQYQELAEGERGLGDEDGYFGEILTLLDTVLGRVR